MPLTLSPEEVRLAVDKLQIAQIFQTKFNNTVNNEQNLQKIQSNMKMKLLEKLKHDRQKQMEDNFEKIFTGKLSKMKQSNTDADFEDEETLQKIRETIQAEQIVKINEICCKEVDSITRFYIESPYEQLKVSTVSMLDPLETNSLSMLKYKTFEHFWNMGYYLTSGLKFGAHFMAYDHDPKLFHAKFLIICLLEENFQHFEENMLQCYGRLGKNVRKNVIISCFDQQNQIQLKLIEWNQLNC